VKKGIPVILLPGFLFLFPSLVQSQPDKLFERLLGPMLQPGYSEFLFPYTRYQFQGFDHCFTVNADVERTPYRMDAAKEFCAKPYGWSLRP
jgi:hypothetical protein